ncbi:hypothetical protein [Spirosoma telluris]
MHRLLTQLTTPIMGTKHPVVHFAIAQPVSAFLFPFAWPSPL